MPRDIIVLVEHVDGKIDSVTLQLLAAGRQLATALNTQLIALALGHELNGLGASLQNYAMDKIILVDNSAIPLAAGEVQAKVIAQVAKQLEPRLMLIGVQIGQQLGRVLVARIHTQRLTRL